MPVDGAQMSEIEIARGDALLDPERHQLSFMVVEFSGVTKVEPVSQDSEVRRVTVDLVAHSAA
jgi:hypothetical protein